jgi:hypothetical protein
MEIRQQYIKPSVLRLQYVEDVAVCNLGNCKSNSASQGQCLGSNGTTCASPSACNTFGS